MPTLTAYSQELNHYVRIETIGAPATGGGNETLSLYVFEQVPDNNWTPAATQRFISGLRLGEGFSQRVDILGGVADVSGIDFEVQDFRDAASGVTTYFWAALMATERWNADPASFPHTFLTGGAAGVGTIFDRDDVTALVESTVGFPAAPSSFWLGGPGNQECCRYTGTTATTFTGLGRGRHSATGNTFSRTHRVGVDADGASRAPVLITTRPQSFFGLRFAVYAIARRRDGTWEPEASAVRRYTGHLRHVDYVPERNSFRFRCDSMLEQLDREIYAPDVRYQSRIIGVYLGPRALDRRFTVETAGTVVINFTLSSSWYSSVHELKDAINDATTAYWEANAIDLRLQPYLVSSNTGSTLPEDAPPDTWYWTCPSTTSQVSVQMSPGIRNALGFGEIAVWFDGFVNESVPAMHPWPETALYWPAGLDSEVTLRVASREGVVTDQGDIAAGPLLIGGLYSARATGSAGGVEADTLTVRSLFDGEEFPLVDHARGITIAVDRNGQPFAADNFRQQGNDTVEQVFVPSARSTLATTVRRILASTGTAGYNGLDDDLADGYGVGIDDSDVDLPSILTAFRDAGLEADDQFRYLWRGPQKVRDLLDDIGRVLGVVYVMRQGQIVARASTPFALASASVATITDNDLATESDLPAYAISPGQFYSGAEIKWAWDPIGQKFTRGPLVIRTSPGTSGNENRLRTIEARGLSGRPDTIAPVLANMASWLALLARPQARLNLRLSSRWANRLVPADVVALTLSELHNARTGGYGTTAVLAIVLSVKETWRDDVSVELLVLNEQRQAPLAPSALLDYSRPDGGWDAVNNRLYLRDNEFTAAPDLDLNWFLANDRILVCQDNAADPTAPRLWRVTVLSVTDGGVGSRYLTLTGPLPAPAFVAADHYFVTFDTYDVVPSGRYDDGTWVADDADSRIGATSDWYPYT